MFYCEQCRKENDYPPSISGHPDTYGNCEICKKRMPCHDVNHNNVKSGYTERQRIVDKQYDEYVKSKSV